MIKVYSGLKGLAAFLFLMAGVVLFFSVFFWGIKSAVGLLLPVLESIAAMLIIVFVGGILPLSFFKERRVRLAGYSIVMSQLLSVITWMIAFLYVVTALGFWGIFFSFLFQLLAPVAFVGAVLKGSWGMALELSLWIAFTYVMRFYSHWLLHLNVKPAKKADIIDVEIVRSS